LKSYQFSDASKFFSAKLTRFRFRNFFAIVVVTEVTELKMKESDISFNHQYLTPSILLWSTLASNILFLECVPVHCATRRKTEREIKEGLKRETVSVHAYKSE
jgi:hypothetical protein